MFPENSHKPKGFHQDSGWWAVLLGLQPQGGLLLAAGAIEKQFSIANLAVCWENRSLNGLVFVHTLFERVKIVQCGLSAGKSS